MGKGFKFGVGFVLGNAMMGAVAAFIVISIETLLDTVAGRLSEARTNTADSGTPVSVPGGTVVPDDAVE